MKEDDNFDTANSGELDQDFRKLLLTGFQKSPNPQNLIFFLTKKGLIL